MIRSSKSIDSNEIKKNKGRNNNATKKTIIKFKNKYISSDKNKRIQVHHKVNMLRREKTNGTDSYKSITQKKKPLVIIYL